MFRSNIVVAHTAGLVDRQFHHALGARGEVEVAAAGTRLRLLHPDDQFFDTAWIQAQFTQDSASYAAFFTQQALEEEVGAVKKRIAEAAMELEKLGIELKDCQLGLVDFPAKVGGDIAYLCWKFDEPRIDWWHEIDAGFGGRQPLERSE